ncbi:hypothetical protein KPL33_01175 [Clostridium algidicarnis]|uniref:hypothetical protein n=1 Tax=Clostridium algidicarnis TaxID=37659 RepID=UPI001C0D0025|nr:hypothetical protein [Clostridium algidicarnis]MBU3205589.1 hypothetical protein [Clostridium algidicarnis]
MKEISEVLKKLSPKEIEAINWIYQYGYKEIESMRLEELAYTLEEGLDGIENSIENLVHNEIVIKNGDRLSINRKYIKKLISMEILDIDGVIGGMANEVFETNLQLGNMRKEILELKTELTEVKNTYKELKKKLV